MTLEKLYGVERELRELATKIQLEQRYPSEEEIEKLSKEVDEAVSNIGELHQAAEELGRITGMESSTLHYARERVWELGDELRFQVRECMQEGKRPRECKASGWLSDVLKRLAASVNELTGKRCNYVEWTGEGGEASLAMAMNDASSCVHRLADWLSERTKDVEVRGKCIMQEGANPAVKSACRKWDRATEGMKYRGLYEKHDYEALSGRAIGDRLMLRVGSAMGHATHLDLERGRLDYFDEDDEVNYAMERLWEELAGLDCEVRSRAGVTCEGLTEDNIDKAAVVAAAATSMDYRIEKPWDYWTESSWEAEAALISPILKRIGEAVEAF